MRSAAVTFSAQENDDDFIPETNSYNSSLTQFPALLSSPHGISNNNNNNNNNTIVELPQQEQVVLLRPPFQTWNSLVGADHDSANTSEISPNLISFEVNDDHSTLLNELPFSTIHTSWVPKFRKCLQDFKSKSPPEMYSAHQDSSNNNGKKSQQRRRSSASSSSVPPPEIYSLIPVWAQDLRRTLTSALYSSGDPFAMTMMTNSNAAKQISISIFAQRHPYFYAECMSLARDVMKLACWMMSEFEEEKETTPSHETNLKKRTKRKSKFSDGDKNRDESGQTIGDDNDEEDQVDDSPPQPQPLARVNTATPLDPATAATHQNTNDRKKSPEPPQAVPLEEKSSTSSSSSSSILRSSLSLYLLAMYLHMLPQVDAAVARELGKNHRWSLTSLQQLAVMAQMEIDVMFPPPLMARITHQFLEAHKISRGNNNDNNNSSSSNNNGGFVPTFDAPAKIITTRFVPWLCSTWLPFVLYSKVFRGRVEANNDNNNNHYIDERIVLDPNPLCRCVAEIRFAAQITLGLPPTPVESPSSNIFNKNAKLNSVASLSEVITRRARHVQFSLTDSSTQFSRMHSFRSRPTSPPPEPATNSVAENSIVASNQQLVSSSSAPSSSQPMYEETAVANSNNINSNKKSKRPPGLFDDIPEIEGYDDSDSKSNSTSIALSGEDNNYSNSIEKQSNHFNEGDRQEPLPTQPSKKSSFSGLKRSPSKTSSTMASASINPSNVMLLDIPVALLLLDQQQQQQSNTPTAASSSNILSYLGRPLSPAPPHPEDSSTSSRHLHHQLQNSTATNRGVMMIEKLNDMLKENISFSSSTSSSFSSKLSPLQLRHLLPIQAYNLVTAAVRRGVNLGSAPQVKGSGAKLLRDSGIFISASTFSRFVEVLRRLEKHHLQLQQQQQQQKDLVNSNNNSKNSAPSPASPKAPLIDVLAALDFQMGVGMIEMTNEFLSQNIFHLDTNNNNPPEKVVTNNKSRSSNVVLLELFSQNEVKNVVKMVLQNVFLTASSSSPFSRQLSQTQQQQNQPTAVIQNNASNSLDVIELEETISLLSKSVSSLEVASSTTPARKSGNGNVNPPFLSVSPVSVVIGLQQVCFASRFSDPFSSSMTSQKNKGETIDGVSQEKSNKNNKTPQKSGGGDDANGKNLDDGDDNSINNNDNNNPLLKTPGKIRPSTAKSMSRVPLPSATSSHHAGGGVGGISCSSAPHKMSLPPDADAKGTNRYKLQYHQVVPVQTELNYFPLPGQFNQPRVLKSSPDHQFFVKSRQDRTSKKPTEPPACAFPHIPPGLNEHLTVGNSAETASVELVALRRQMKSSLSVVEIAKSCPRLIPAETVTHAARTLTTGADSACGVRALRSLQSDAQLRLGAPSHLGELRPVSAAAVVPPSQHMRGSATTATNSPIAAIGEPNWRNVVYAGSRLDEKHRENRRMLRKIRREDVNEYDNDE